MKNFLIFILTFLIIYNLNAQTNFSSFSSSTSITSELSGIVLQTDIEPDEIITSQEIKFLGIDNIADLLKYIDGVNIYQVSNSSVEFSIRGMPAFYRIQPLILIDGMEISHIIYDKRFFYSFPVNIDDIEKIEVIKDPTKFVNGVESPGGVINIITKKPELLEANYLNSYFGNNGLINNNFSINKFYKKTYFKFTGEFKKANKYHSSKRGISKRLFSLYTTNFFKDYKLSTKFSYMNIDFSYLDFYRFLMNKKQFNSLTIDYKFKNENSYNILINLDSPTSTLTLYSNFLTGKIGHSKLNDFYSEFYKISYKKFFNIKSLNFTPGIIGELFNTRINSQGSGKRESLILFLNSEWKIFNNLKFCGLIKNERARNLGNELSFKMSLMYFKNNFKVKLGYAKNFRNPSLIAQYYSLHDKFNFENLISLNGNVISNKNLKPEKFYSTYFFIAKKFNKLSLKGEFFYNRMTDMYISYADLKIFPPEFDITLKNKYIFSIHGISGKIKYKFSKHLWTSSSFYIQHFKEKVTNLQGNWLIPKYKILNQIYFDYPLISGNIKYSYTPRIKTLCFQNSSYLSKLDLSLYKEFLNHKLIFSVNIQNILGNNRKEALYGNRLDRNIIFKIKYNF